MHELVDVWVWATFSAATAKQKAKYVSNMVVRAKELRAVITKYNSVVVHFPESGYTATSFNEIKGGEFQWTEPRARNHIAGVSRFCYVTLYLFMDPIYRRNRLKCQPD